MFANTVGWVMNDLGRWRENEEVEGDFSMATSGVSAFGTACLRVH